MREQNEAEEMEKVKQDIDSCSRRASALIYDYMEEGISAEKALLTSLISAVVVEKSLEDRGLLSVSKLAAHTDAVYHIIKNIRRPFPLKGDVSIIKRINAPDETPSEEEDIEVLNECLQYSTHVLHSFGGNMLCGKLINILLFSAVMIAKSFDLSSKEIINLIYAIRESMTIHEE